MNIIIPILYGTVALGLFVPKLTRGTFVLAVLLIVAVLLKYYVSN